MFGTHTHQEFNTALQSFIEGCVKISNASAMLCGYDLSAEWLQKRVRVVRSDVGNVNSRSVHCFVDMATGDVLKADGWAKPAKHARGNIYDAKNGLGGMSPYGANYLR